MKLRTVHLPSPAGPEQTRDQVAYVLGHLGWTGSWVDPWSGLAQQGSEGASAIAGPFAGFCEVHWVVEAAPTGETRVTIRQVRNSWFGKGGIVEGKRAGKRLDELVGALQGLWSATGAVAAPAGPSTPGPSVPTWGADPAPTGGWAAGPATAPDPPPPTAWAAGPTTPPPGPGVDPSPWAPQPPGAHAVPASPPQSDDRSL